MPRTPVLLTISIEPNDAILRFCPLPAVCQAMHVQAKAINLICPMTSVPTSPTGTSRKHLLPWIRISLLCCLMLYSLTRAIDYLHQAGCAQNPGVGATIASADLGMISAGFQWLFMLSGAAILGTWPGVSKWRRLGQASVFLVLSFCLSVVLSVWYEDEVAETCAQPGVTQPANARTP